MRTTKPGQSALLLLDAVEILTREDVDYLVIGAFALSIYGPSRASIDADALLNVSLAKIRKLRKIFEGLGLKAELREGDPNDPIPAIMLLTDSHGNRVDLLGGLRGFDPTAFSRAIEVRFQGQNLSIVGREDFIAMKCFAGRPWDLMDAKAAYQEAEGPIDLDLMRRMARRFGRDAADGLEEILTPARRI